MSSQLREIAPKRKLSEISAPCSSDAANGRRDHLEAQALERYKSKEALGIGRDPCLKLYVWQDPHQPREVLSDGEDDEWRGPTGSLLGSDVLVRRYHSSEFGSTPQESQQEFVIRPGNGPTEIQPRCHTAQESRKELDIAPANRLSRAEPITKVDPWVLARTHKYGRRQTSAKVSQIPKCLSWGMNRITKEFVRQHSTDHYTRFDSSTPYRVQAVKRVQFHTGGVFYDHEGYHLCMDPNITNALEIPQLPVRLDDRLVALAYEHFGWKERHRLWPSEFGYNGYVRTGRIPLGFAAKHEYKVGDVDFDGNVLQPGEEGWYYLWLGGVHCLMGKEGMDAGRFQLPDFSCRKIIGFAFRKSHRAEIQAPPGVESE